MTFIRYFSIASSSLLSTLPRFSFCNIAALPSSHAHAPNPKVIACTDTAQSWSSEAPPSQLLISPAFTPGCPRASGSPSRSRNHILEPRVLRIFDNKSISQPFNPGLFTMTFLCPPPCAPPNIHLFCTSASHALVLMTILFQSNVSSQRGVLLAALKQPILRAGHTDAPMLVHTGGELSSRTVSLFMFMTSEN
jgi:hypothetical protein